MASFEIWLIGGLAAASIISARVLPLAVGMGVVFWTLRWVVHGRPSVSTPADWPIAGLLLMIPVTLWVTIAPDVTVPQVYRLLTGVALYYAIVNWAVSLARLRLLITALACGGVLLALTAPLSLAFANDAPVIPSRLYRYFTTFVGDSSNPNVVAGALILLLPCTVAIPLFNWDQLPKHSRILSSIASIVMLLIVPLTQSRGAWIALAVAVSVLALLRWRRGWPLLPLCAPLVAITIYFVGFAQLLNLFTASDALGGLDGRIEVWSRAMYMIEDFPFTGIGMGTFAEVSDALYPLFLAQDGLPHAHSLFLQITVDLGIPGLIFWLAIVMYITTTSWKVFQLGREQGNLYLAGLGAGVLSSQIALILHGVTDAVTWGMVRPAVIVWGVWGLAVAAGRQSKSNEREGMDSGHEVMEREPFQDLGDEVTQP